MSSWQEVEGKVDRLLGASEIARDIERRTVEVIGLQRMAKPSYVAERLKALKTTIEAESDKLLTEIEGVAGQGVQSAFDKGRAFLATQRADLEGLEAELAQLSNLPLDGSTTSEKP